MNLSPMEQMKRHFAETAYQRGYAVARKAYKLGGLSAVWSILYDTNYTKHGFYSHGISRFQKGVISFLNRL